MSAWPASLSATATVHVRGEVFGECVWALSSAALLRCERCRPLFWGGLRGGGLKRRPSRNHAVQGGDSLGPKRQDLGLMVSPLLQAIARSVVWRVVRLCDVRMQWSLCERRRGACVFGGADLWRVIQLHVLGLTPGKRRLASVRVPVRLCHELPVFGRMCDRLVSSRLLGDRRSRALCLGSWFLVLTSYPLTSCLDHAVWL